MSPHASVHCAGDGPIAALVGGSSCSIGSALQRSTFNDYEIISPYRLKRTPKKENTTALSNNVHESRKMFLVSLQHKFNNS